MSVIETRVVPDDERSEDTDGEPIAVVEAMPPDAEVLRQAFLSTQNVLVNVQPHQLDLPTLVPSWTVRDLVNHIVGGANSFAGTIESGTASERDIPDDFEPQDMNDALADAAERVVDAAHEGADKIITVPGGVLAGSVLLWVAALETCGHGWDLAQATGRPVHVEPTIAEHLIEGAQVMARSLGRTEPQSVVPVVEAPDPESAAGRLAAVLGRDPVTAHPRGSTPTHRDLAGNQGIGRVRWHPLTGRRPVHRRAMCWLA